MKNKLIFFALGLLLGIFGAWIVLSNSNNIFSKRDNSTQMAQSSDVLDAHFIEQMIPHHEDAITMANIALEKAEHQEIQQLSRNIIDSQGKEIAQMKEWYKEWFKRELPTGEEVMSHHGMGSSIGMHMGIRGDNTDIQILTEAENFDIAFIEHMIPHHQMAVMMASMLKNSSEREEMKNLADEIIIAQSSEIEQMRGWLRDWK